MDGARQLVHVGADSINFLHIGWNETKGAAWQRGSEELLALPGQLSRVQI